MKRKFSFIFSRYILFYRKFQFFTPFFLHIIFSHFEKKAVDRIFNNFVFYDREFMSLSFIHLISRPDGIEIIVSVT